MRDHEALEAGFVTDMRERMTVRRPAIAAALDTLTAQAEPVLALLAEADPRALATARRLPWPDPPRTAERFTRIKALRQFLTSATGAPTLAIGARALDVVDDLDVMDDAWLSAGFELEWRREVEVLVDLARLVPIAAAELHVHLVVERSLRDLDDDADATGRPSFLRIFYDGDTEGRT